MGISLIKRYAVNFLGGIGIGYVIVMALIVGAMYAAWVHGERISDTVPRP